MKKSEESCDYRMLLDKIDEYGRTYKSFKVFSLGYSLFGREIPVIKLGEGNINVLYVGTHRGTERITSAVLLRFANEYCRMYECGKSPFGFDMTHLYRTRSIYIVPMLNPDGAELSAHGADEENPLLERLLRMNKGSSDFGSWQANGRGVDLAHNYNANFAEYKSVEANLGISGGAPAKYSGEYPESEPETAALCRMIRIIGNFSSLISLHTRGEENISYAPYGSERIAKYMSRISGYAIKKDGGTDDHGGLKDWFISECSNPAFTFECGKGEELLSFSQELWIYRAIREILFSFPLIFGEEV